MGPAIRRIALLGAALASLPIAVAVAAARDPFLVPVSAKATGFGPFREGGTPTSRGGAAQRRSARRRPVVKNSKRPVHAALEGGRRRRAPDDVRPADRPVCRQGYFVNARLSDKRWHTSAGIRPGSTERAAQRVSKRSCGDACEFPGYVLGLHPNDCAGAQTPSVIAQVHDGKVVALRVLTHGCE